MTNQTTLKQIYQNKKLIEISQKVKRADYVLNENNPNYHAKLLLEALDQDEYDKASKVIEKLQGLSGAAEKAGLKTLSDAMDKAVEEINKFTGGGITDRVKSKLASIFSKSAPSENPILKGLAFASSLEKGFGALPTILKNNIKDINNKKGQKISEILTDDKAKKAFTNILQKAFIPEGTFGKLFGKIPYVSDINVVVNEMLESTPEKLAAVIKPATSGAKTSDIDPKIANPKANEGGGPLDKVKDKISSAKSLDDIVGVLKTLDQNTEIKNKITPAKLIKSIEKLKSDGGASKYTDDDLIKKFGMLSAGGLRAKVLEIIKGGKAAGGGGSKPAAGGQPGPAPGKAPEGKGKDANVQATQDGAKKAGIKDAKSLQVLLDTLDYDIGSLEGSLVVPQIQKLMRSAGLDEDQADGFIRGLMANFETDFKPKLADAINKEVEKRKKELESKGGGSKPAGGGGAPAGGTPTT